MQIKDIPAMWVLAVRRRLRIPDIAPATAEFSPLIERQIEEAGMEAAGPWLFISRGLPGDASTAFDWEICRPVVRPQDYRGAAALGRLPPVTVASREHEGALNTLFSEGYAPLIREVEASGRALSGESREVYHAWNGPEVATNRVEIQFCLRR